MLDKGRKECVDVDCKKPTDETNFKLVYASGETQNEHTIIDEDFDVEVDQSIKLIRCVEMFQWIEHSRKDRHHHEYHYDRQWRNHQVNSDTFNQPTHKNPEMPFMDKTILGNHISFGGYILADEQKDLLDNKVALNYTKDFIDRTSRQTSSKLHSLGYGNIHMEGNTLVAKMNRNSGEGFDVGDIRITFFRVPCGPTTIVAQQIKEIDGLYTFRKWNPNFPMAAVGQDNSPKSERVCLVCACCPCAQLIDECFASMYPEVLQIVKDQPLTKEEAFKEAEKDQSLRTTIFRFCGWVLLWIGIWLLFSPIITFVSFVPLVGYMISAGFSMVAIKNINDSKYMMLYIWFIQ